MKNSLFLITFIALLACSAKKEGIDAKEYYFPYPNFKEPVTYTYVELSDTNEKAYWVMYTNFHPAPEIDTTFHTKIFNRDHQIQEVLSEFINKDGSVLGEHKLIFWEDSATWVECEVKERDVFKWPAKQGDKYTWSISYKHPNGKYSIHLAKTRSFNGETVKITYKGTAHKCLVFRDAFKLVGTDTENHTSTYQYSMDSYYAKGLGLIRYTLHYPNEKQKTYELVSH